MFELKVLGGAFVHRSDGTQIAGAIAQRRSLALLALLAVHGKQGIRRERILALLWPDGDPEKTRHALTQSLYQVRRSLTCDDVLDVTPAEVRLNGARIRSDVEQLEHAIEAGDDERAAALYRGPFMDGFVLPSCVEFDQWVSIERARLQSIMASVYERIAVRAEQQGDWARAIGVLKKMVALDPLSARSTILLMRSYVSSGDRPSAVQHGRVHGLLLKEQLELDPDPGVESLVDELRRAVDVTLPAPPSAPSRPPSPPSAAPAPLVVSNPTPLGSLRIHASGHRWRRWIVSGSVAIAASSVVVAAVLSARPRPAGAVATSPVLGQSVAIAPFRVSGADNSLGYLREGLVELLSSRLADDSAARAIDPGRVLGAWHRAHLTGAADTPHPQALRIARQLGATRIVIGGVVGQSSKLVINASLIDVSSAQSHAQAQVEGPADSITTLVDRLAAKLVASSAGEGDRLSDHFTPSLAALREFLDGQAAYRRGDYARAVPAYERSLARDSGFGLAAMHLALAADRLNDAEQHDRALAIAWANRRDLNERDLAHLIAFAGPRYPAPSLEAEQLAAWERAVVSAPDRADVLYELGERLFRIGGVVSAGNPHGRASTVLARVLELEPTHERARRLLILLAARAGDIQLLSRIATPSALRDSVGDLSEFLRWRVAVVRGDSSELRSIRAVMARMNDQSLRAMAMSSLSDAVGIEDGQRAALLTTQRAVRAPASFDALMEQHSIALNQGRPRAALEITNQIQERHPGSRAHLRLRILDAIYAEGDSLAAIAAADSLTSMVDGPLADDLDARSIQLADACVVEQWRLRGGATASTRRTIARLRSAALPRRIIPVSANQLACAELLGATLAVVTRQSDATARIAALDSLIVSGPAMSDASSYAHIAIGRLYLRLGNRSAAFAAFQRRSYMTGWPRYLSTVRREEAALAAALGNTGVARISYARYMALRRFAEQSPNGTIPIQSGAHSLETPSNRHQ